MTRNATTNIGAVLMRLVLAKLLTIFSFFCFFSILGFEIFGKWSFLILVVFWGSSGEEIFNLLLLSKRNFSLIRFCSSSSSLRFFKNSRLRFCHSVKTTSSFSGVSDFFLGMFYPFVTFAISSINNW